MTAKLEDCSRPEVHRELAQRLLADGYVELGRIEGQIADGLLARGAHGNDISR